MISLKQAATLAKKGKKAEDKLMHEIESDAENCCIDVEKTQELLGYFKDKQDNVKIADLSRIIICLGHNPADLDLSTVTQEFRHLGVDSLPVDKYTNLLKNVIASLFKAKVMKTNPLANFLKISKHHKTK